VFFVKLQNSFPDKKACELLKIEKGFYKHFCDIFIESVKILTISKTQVKKRFRVKNPELMQDYYKKGQSVILYAAHLGNWEWMASLPLHIPHQFLSFYQEQSNKYFDKLMILIRERFDNICVESKAGYKTLMTYSKNNELTLTCMIGDQSPTVKSPKHWTKFLNQETAFLIGAARLAIKCQQVLLYPRMTEIRRGYYEFEFIVIEGGDNSQDVIDAYAKLLEENITAQPTLWLWSHRRWKLKNIAMNDKSKTLSLSQN
jgi:KDO2-lipid IV(A) lauroyltransferase